MLTYLHHLYEHRPWEHSKPMTARNGGGAPEWGYPSAERAQSRTRTSDDDEAALRYSYSAFLADLLPPTDGDVHDKVSDEREHDAGRTPRLFIDLSEFANQRAAMAAEQQKKSDDEWKALPASKLGEYVVIRDIAEGTFGKVRSE